MRQFEKFECKSQIVTLSHKLH